MLPTYVLLFGNSKAMQSRSMQAFAIGSIESEAKQRFLAGTKGEGLAAATSLLTSVKATLRIERESKNAGAFQRATLEQAVHCLSSQHRRGRVEVGLRQPPAELCLACASGAQGDGGRVVRALP